MRYVKHFGLLPNLEKVISGRLMGRFNGEDVVWEHNPSFCSYRLTLLRAIIQLVIALTLQLGETQHGYT